MSPAVEIPRAGPAYRVCAGIAFAVFDLQRWRFDVQGVGHVPDRGGVVIAANHTSFWDFFTVGRPIYRQLRRPVRILAKQSLFRTPVFGPLMRRAQHIPVQRGEGEAALVTAVSALRAGEVVLVMPEQTISPSFDLLAFRTGAARMAAKAGVPLVPAVSWGTQRFHTVARRPTVCWRLPVQVAYGQPLRPTPEDDPVEVTEMLRQRVQALLDTSQASYRDRGLAPGAWWQPARLGGSAPPHEVAQEATAQLEAQWRQDSASSVDA